LQPSPDTEEVRQHLLELLLAIKERPAEEYPMGMYGDELVVWQLGAFGERRALPELKRIITFDTQISVGHFGRTRESLVSVAKEAIAKIGDEAAGDDVQEPPSSKKWWQFWK